MSAFNGSGTFVISGSGLPFVTGTTISSTVANQLNTDLATGLSTCLTKDGQTTPTGNIPLGGFKVTGLAVATTLGDALSYGRAATVTTLSTSGLATLASMAVTAGLPGNFANTGTVTVNASSTSGTLALPLGGGVIVLTQSGPIGSGATALVYHNQASIVAITTLGTAISTGSTNIASINLVTNGFTVTTGAVGGATLFSYLVITTP